MHAREAYDWPGNVRELHNALLRGVTLCTNSTIQPGDLPEAIWAATMTHPDSTHEPAAADREPPERHSEARPVGAGGLLGNESFCLNPLLPPDLSPLAQARIQAEIQCIVEALAKYKNNRSRTAEGLGISRVALYKKLHRYGLMPT